MLSPTLRVVVPCRTEIECQRSATGAATANSAQQVSDTRTPIPDGIGRRRAEVLVASAAGRSLGAGLLALRPRLTTGLPLSTAAPVGRRRHANQAALVA